MKNAGALDTLFRIFESLAHNMGKIRNRAVDFWIKPDTSRFGLAEFHRTAEIAAVGEAAARRRFLNSSGTSSNWKNDCSNIPRRPRTVFCPSRK